MAAAPLTLDVPLEVVLPATIGKQREVVIPAGARSSEYSSWTDDTGGTIYIEASGTDDTGDRTANHMRYDADVPWSRRVWGSGGGRSDALAAAKSIFVSGTVASQKVKFLATGDSQ